MAVNELLGKTAAGAAAGSAGGPVGTIIGAGVGLASSIASGLFGSHNTKVANEMSLENAKEMARINDLYQRNIIRDSPALQKRGLEAAGLSPALVDNIASVTSSDANATPPTAKAAPVPQLPTASDVASLITADAQAKVSKAQADNLNADTELKLTESQYKPLILQASLDFQKLVNDQEEIKKNIASRTQDSEIQKALDSARLVGDQADLVEIDLALRKVDQKYYDKQKANELLIQLQTLDNLRKDGKIKDKQVGLLAAQTVAAYASAVESRSAADYNRSLKKQVDELTPVIRKKYNNEAAVAFQTYGKVQAEKGLIQWENKVKSHLDPETESYMRRWSQVLGGGAEATGMVRDGAITYGMTKPTPKPQPVKGFKK